MKLKVVAVSIVFMTVGLFSCKKSDLDSKKDLLASKAWKFMNCERQEAVGGAPGPWKSLYDIWPQCHKDDVTFFRKDGSYEQNEGPTRCGTQYPDIVKSGTWSLLSDGGLAIGIGVNSGSTAYDIMTLDKNTLIIEARGRRFYNEGERWTYTH